ncbi:MAG: 50S ribosomal protein L1 [bacterium]|nr:50S ribosomal protein L1 [bacterium]
MSHGKRYTALAQAAPKEMVSVAEALTFIKEQSNEKFDATVELHVRLGIDPKQSDQSVRGSVALPAGTGKTLRVAAVVSGNKEKEAKEAGADLVGGDDIIEQIKQNKMDFDVLIATPDMMPLLGKVAKVLGPRGLMPNPKTETVGPDIGRMVKAIKAGKANYKNDIYGIVHMPVGKKSFSLEDLTKNVESALESIRAAKPESLKGSYIKSASLSSTMGPGLQISLK